ncbi:hypothetical protein SGO_0462 [Streptococcus gordonii str. Challis substr. CH1]|uniref:Uncharacterized protein n=1 Tax=Streptococcus gordonii (strain Challis / ATCC 35105 / BCRC 15272 / CH1 / DL1 / V288) TaxID=467705 RepID=A8AVG8_STRGC|nr:hypothetical protein SGO_0462 [Streptococcus gordonii str. Challis substr. CH1]
MIKYSENLIYIRLCECYNKEKKPTERESYGSRRGKDLKKQEETAVSSLERANSTKEGHDLSGCFFIMDSIFNENY